MLSDLVSTDIALAARRLADGGLVAIPTETVYGLAADAEQSDAVGRIFDVKGRPRDHPLIVHLAGLHALDGWAHEVTPAVELLGSACWPGPLTMIVRRGRRVSDAVTGGRDTVGLRVPAHAMALDLLERLDGGLAAPSANRFGRVSPTTAQHVVDDLARATGGRAVLRDASGLVAAAAGEETARSAVETYPVRAAGRPLGELTLEPGDERTPQAGLLARQAAEVAAMGLIDSLARLETEERLGADLVEQVLEGGLSEESLAARLSRLGYRVLRLSYEQIHHDWENTRLVLLRLLRSGLHLAEPVPL